MYKKIESLKYLAKLGLNTHETIVPSNFYEFFGAIIDWQHCTIRTDHKSMTDDLPFYIVAPPHDIEFEYINSLWQEIQKNNYKAIIANGIKYDPIQEYNMVIYLEPDGYFSLEASDLKVPLRHMYRDQKHLLSCSGNMSDNINAWHFFNNVKILDRVSLRNDIQDIYSLGIFNKWLELTKYPIPVGVKHNNMVFWQVK